MPGPLQGVKIVELAGIGPGPVRRDAALRHGRRRRARRPRRSRSTGGFDPGGRAGARPRPPVDRRRPQAPRRRRDGAAARRAGRRAHRGLPARRHRAARPRPRRLPRAQPAARLRPHDRAGARTARWRTPPATTSTTSRSPARSRTSVARASKPTPPINLVGDFGGGGMFLAFGIVCGDPRGARRRARARSSTPRWSTAPRCSCR